MASGHVNRIYRPKTWLHRPMLQNVKKTLANSEPSSTRAASILSSRPHISIAVDGGGGCEAPEPRAREPCRRALTHHQPHDRRSGGWPRDDPRGAKCRDVRYTAALGG